MLFVDVNQQQSEEWRAGVTTRMRASAANGAAQLCMFEQWCDPGNGAPTHLHAVEEVLCVREEFVQVLGDGYVCRAFDRNPEGPKYLFYSE